MMFGFCPIRVLKFLSAVGQAGQYLLVNSSTMIGAVCVWAYAFAAAKVTDIKRLKMAKYLYNI